MYLCNCVSMYLFICVLHTHMYTRGACGGLSWAQVPELSLHLHSAVVTTLCKRCSHIAAMCTNIINCFSKSHFSCAGLPSYDITGRQFEWFKIVKSKSQQLNSSQLNVCPGWGGGWVLLLQMANAARSSAAGSFSLQPMHCIECKRRFWGRGRVITQVCTVCTLHKYALLGITGSPAST